MRFIFPRADLSPRAITDRCTPSLGSPRVLVAHLPASLLASSDGHVPNEMSPDARELIGLDSRKGASFRAPRLPYNRNPRLPPLLSFAPAPQLLASSESCASDGKTPLCGTPFVTNPLFVKHVSHTTPCGRCGLSLLCWEVCYNFAVTFTTIAPLQTNDSVYDRRRECEQGPCGHLVPLEAKNCVNECVSPACYRKTFAEPVRGIGR